MTMMRLHFQCEVDLNCWLIGNKKKLKQNSLLGFPNIILSYLLVDFLSLHRTEKKSPIGIISSTLQWILKDSAEKVPFFPMYLWCLCTQWWNWNRLFFEKAARWVHFKEELSNKDNRPTTPDLDSTAVSIFVICRYIETALLSIQIKWELEH